MDFGSMMSGAAGGAVVSVIISAKDDYSKALKGAQTSFQKFGGVAKVAALAAGAALVGFAAKAISTAAESEKVTNRVKLSFGNMAQSVLEASSRMQEGSVKDDETIAQGFVELENKIGSLGFTFEQQSKLIQGALDISAKTGKEFNVVLNQMAAGFMGRTIGLKELGIVVEAGADKMEIYNTIMAKATDATGAAEAESKTFAGTMTQLKNTIDDAMQAAGEELLPIMKDVLEIFKENKTEIVTFIVTLGQVIGGLVKGIAWIADTISKIMDMVAFRIGATIQTVSDLISLLKGDIGIKDFIANQKNLVEISKDPTAYRQNIEKSQKLGNTNMLGDLPTLDNTRAKEDNTDVTEEETDVKKELTETEKALLEQMGFNAEQISMINELDTVNIKNTGEVNTKLSQTSSALQQFQQSLSAPGKGGKGGGLDSLGLGRFTTKEAGFERYAQYQSAGLIKSYKKSDGTWSDFMQRPGQAPTSFSPDDTIIGVKDPSKLSGKEITINIGTVQGLSGEEISKALAKELRQYIAY